MHIYIYYAYIYIYIMHIYIYILCIYIYIMHIPGIFQESPRAKKATSATSRPGKHAGLETLQLKSWRSPGFFP